MIAVAVFALMIGAAANAIPALSQPFWADEDSVPPGLEGEEGECPYAHQHRYENYEDSPYGGEPGEERRWGGGEGSRGYGCGGSSGRGGGSMGPRNGSGNRWGSG